MSELPIRIEVMPPCLCESKVIGYEYSEGGFNVTHCACGGVMSCKEIEGVEVKKPFDITKHEFSDSNFKTKAYVSDGELIIGASEYEIPFFCANKSDAIAIAKALGVTGEDLK